MITILFRTLIIYVLLTAGMRFTGKRQIGELEITELITTLLLSELAAMPIAAPEIPLIHAIVPIILLITLEVIITFFNSKCISLKKVLEGKPSIIIKDGIINQKELIKIRMSVEELLGQLRVKGISNPCDVKYAMFEQDGQLSVFEKSKPSHEIVYAVVINGHISKSNLNEISKDKTWVLNQLAKKCRPLKDVFLFTVDEKGKQTIIYKED